MIEGEGHVLGQLLSQQVPQRLAAGDVHHFQNQVENKSQPSHQQAARRAEDLQLGNATRLAAWGKAQFGRNFSNFTCVNHQASLCAARHYLRI